MKKSIVALIFTMVWSCTTAQDSAALIFAEGNKAYQDKAYEKAIGHYEQQLKSGYRSADLEYNLGNAWYKMESPGRAVLHYERALLHEPGHSEARKNLAFLRTKINSEIEPLPEFFLSNWWKNARNALSPNAMGMVAMLLWWGGLAGLCARLLAKTRHFKKWGLVGGIALIAASLLPLTLSLSRSAYENNTQMAILLQKSAILRSAPEENGQEVLTLPEGTKLRQLEQLDGWWQVKLENGEIGWLPENAMEEI